MPTETPVFTSILWTFLTEAGRMSRAGGGSLHLEAVQVMPQLWSLWYYVSMYFWYKFAPTMSTSVLSLQS